MSKIIMLNLYRCGSAEYSDTNLDTGNEAFFLTDYFDWIKVETDNSEKLTLHQCLGIKYEANSNLKGVSHQRYCLYTSNKGDETILDSNKELPILTIIQIFRNPDLYQVSDFADGQKANAGSWMQKITEYMNKQVSLKGDHIRWRLFPLLTAGDFALLIRSTTVHEAYDISTAIRSIEVSVTDFNKNIINRPAFYTYSICGVLSSDCTQWTRYLSKNDKIVIRIQYTSSFRERVPKENREIKRDLIKMGDHLFGRYDHQIFYSPEEFQELYPYILEYKSSSLKVNTDSKITYPRVQILVEMLENGYISHLNERLLLRYEQDQHLENIDGEKWEMNSRYPWKDLYNLNKAKIDAIKQKTDQLGEQLQGCYQSARNLKEYVRLLGRFGRIFYEINKHFELQINLANLLEQYECLVNSLQRYVDLYKSEKPKKYAGEIEEYLRYGIGALEIFTRYFRNVNLQTLQTPNFDLQTNMSVVKLLLAYSQFMKPYVKKRKDPYFLRKTLIPIIVPSMRTQDMSVSVLFDASYETEEDFSYLMVVFCPTFAFLCETCFLIPSVFHEISHQFRYEERKQRNQCIKEYILKQFIYLILLDLLDEPRYYDFKNASFLNEVTESVYKEFADFLQEMDEKCYFEYTNALRTELINFISVVKSKDVLIENSVEKYMEMTRESIIEYDEPLLSAVYDIDLQLQEIEKLAAESASKKDIPENYLDCASELIKDISNLKSVQEKQILLSLGKCLSGRNEEYYEELLSSIRSLQSDKSKERSDSEKIRRELFEKWNNTREKMEPKLAETIRHLLKQLHNVNTAYLQFIKNSSDYIGKTERNSELEKSVSPKLFYQAVFNRVCTSIRKELLKCMPEFIENRKNHLEWSEMAIPIEDLQFIIKKIRLLGDDGIRDQVKTIISKYSGETISNFVQWRVNLYGEVTSDLFMCSAMYLNCFGYLVVSAEMLNFRAEHRLAQLQRVFLVEQCLIQSKHPGLTKKVFREEILSRLIDELHRLNDGIQKAQYDDPEPKKVLAQMVGDLNMENVSASLDGIQDILLQCFVNPNDEKNPNASTKNWIIRIYCQIISIIQNLLQYELSSENTGDNTFLQDITSDEAYYSKGEKIREFIRENGDEDLCRSISDILNSPAKYFENKRSLLSQEIEYIFAKYEKSCKSIFEN